MNELARMANRKLRQGHRYEHALGPCHHELSCEHARARGRDRQDADSVYDLEMSGQEHPRECYGPRRETIRARTNNANALLV